LSLAGNGIADYGCVEMAKGLAVNTSVKTLDLGGNGLGSAGCKAIEMALVSQKQRDCRRACRATEVGSVKRVAAVVGRRVEDSSILVIAHVSPCE
jgi:hypothetical protein